MKRYLKKKFLVSFILGTRPEIIKLAPLIIEFRKSKFFNTRIIFTGQHREMAKQVLEIFQIKPDKDLAIMQPKQSLEYITCETIKSISEELREYESDLVIVQGDTSTAFSSALAAFYNKIPIAHIEAGLRTNNILEPFPEEGNRRLISQISTLNFAPTDISRKNLELSGVKNVIVTGNTVIDAINLVKDKLKPFKIKSDNKIVNLILLTVHRRENLGDNLLSIIDAIKKTLNEHQNIGFFIPMHLNPLVRDTITENLDPHERVFLSEPLDYLSLLSVMKSSYLVLTDSGGIQEEAPSLNKPVLVLRNTTERLEGIKSGNAKLIGTNSQDIYKEIDLLLKDKKLYEKMAKSKNPYGDGKSSIKILSHCLKFLNKE